MCMHLTAGFALIAEVTNRCRSVGVNKFPVVYLPQHLLNLGLRSSRSERQKNSVKDAHLSPAFIYSAFTSQVRVH